MSMRVAEYPRPSQVLLHISDTHLRAADGRLYGSVDSAAYLERALADIEASGVHPDALIFTGDLADLGEVAAYETLRRTVDPVAERLGARVIWVMGNHDDRARFRTHLLDEPTTEAAPVDRVIDLDGLRILSLDSTVPGHHHGEITDAQLDWLALELSAPAPRGTILALHHPPIPCVLDLAVSVELHDQHRLEAVLRGTDVRAILAGHLHYSTSATFAGIPVSVASATCYTQDLAVPVGGTRGRDGAQAFNLVHVYDHTIVHSVVPVGQSTVLDYVDAAETARRLAASGIVIPDALGRAARTDSTRTDSTTRFPPTSPIPVLR